MTQKNPNLILYQYWRSSCSWRLRWALNFKGIAYESKSINLLKNEQRSPDYLRICPAGAVPSLVWNGQVFNESLAILEMLEEQWPTPALLPSSSVERARVRQLALTIVAGTQPLQNLSVQQFHSADVMERHRFAAHWIGNGLRVYTKLLRQFESAGNFSFGGALTMADLCLVPQVYNAKRFNVDLSDCPEIEAIYRHCLSLKSCRDAAPDQQPDAVV